MKTLWHGQTFGITGPLRRESTGNLTKARQCRPFISATASYWTYTRLTGDLNSYDALRVVWSIVLKFWRHLWARFKNSYETLTIRALTVSMAYNNHVVQCMDRLFHVEFQGYTLEFLAKIVSTHWKMYISSRGELLRGPRFKSSHAFLEGFCRLFPHPIS